MLKYTNFLVHNLIKLNLKHSKIMSFLRSQHIDISSHCSKVQAENALRNILFNDQVIDAFCDTFRYELAMNPPELEILLGCTRSERLRWTKEKKLPVMYFSDVYKFGSHLMCPMYDRRIIGLKVTDTVLAEWRTEWIRRRRKRRRVGDIQNIIKISIFQNAFFKYFQQLSNEWYQSDYELGLVLETAWWLSFLSYWIKNRRERSATSRLHYYQHKNIENYFINIRSIIITSLIRSKYVNIYLYKPETSDRYTLHLCDEHNTYVWYNNEFISAHEYFYINPEQYKLCKNCKIQKRENYYSSYYIHISYKDFLFVFCIPFNFLHIDYNHIQVINKSYCEGAFRQSKEMIQHDSYIPPEKMVIATLKTLYINLKKLKMNR